MADGHLRVAIFQCALGGKSAEDRLHAIDDTLSNFERSPINLLVCPELFATGYNVGESLRTNAETVNGDFCTAVSALAKKWNTAIVVGYSERDTDAVYNSAACFNKDGRLLANHRKTILPPGIEPQYFDCGQHRTTFSLHGFKVELLICCEIEIPEFARDATRSGTDILVVPTALASNWHQVANHVIPTRAYENAVFVVYANHAGREGEVQYLGSSCIVGPIGQELSRANSTSTVIYSDLDRSEISCARARLPYLPPGYPRSNVSSSNTSRDSQRCFERGYN